MEDSYIATSLVDLITTDAESATLAISTESVEQQPLPIVTLPGGIRTINAAANELGTLFAQAKTHFNRGGAIVSITRDDSGQPKLEELKPSRLASDLETVAVLMEINSKGASKRTICNDAKAKLILDSRAFRDVIPVIRVVSRCPVIIERGGELVQVAGYDPASGILAEGEPAEDVPLAEGIELIKDMLSEFQFTTAADHSRALAACITPALVMGGLLPGRAALDLGEADDSQAGKGFRNKLTAAIYGDVVQAVGQSGKGNGVGSIEETFDSVLIAGRGFISLDNVRGRIDSPKIESFLTEDTYYARCAYHKNVEIDPRRVYVMFTSNRADITKDLANRSSCVRIEKRPGFAFRKYEFGNGNSGSILDLVRAQQPKYLGAVFAVIKAWHAADKPRTDDTRHDFKEWAQVLDWIVQNLFQTAPLLAGHSETQQRMTDPNLNWLRDVMLVITKQDKAGQWMLASDILEALDADGGIEIPGLKDDDDLSNDATRSKVLQRIGKILGRIFDSSDDECVVIDNLKMVREVYETTSRHSSKRYEVSRIGDAPLDVPF